jgi:hypothetical protein
MSKEERELKAGEKRYFQKFINEFKELSQKALLEIEDLKREFIEGSDSSYSIEELEGFKNQLAGLHGFMVAQDNNGKTLEEQLISFKENAEKESKEILNLKNLISNYKDQLYGSEDENGNLIPGLTHKIDNMQKQLAQNIEANEKKQEALLDKIEELLQGASTVALATAFEEHKKQFDKPNKLWQWVFICTLVGLMGLSITAFFVSNPDLKDMWKITLGNLPFIGAGVWLAIFASKQRSQNIRLQQEYAYKEDVAKLYYGLKNEIEQLANTELGQRLNESVIQILVETVSYNPSKTLDNNSHNDKGPILEALKSISESLSLKK